MQAEHHGTEHAHPGPRTYVKIAVILAIITAVEVSFIYLEQVVGVILVPSLLLLSAAKFLLVVQFYMHLKFDHQMFSGFFVFGLIIAISVTIALLALFQGLLPA